MDRFFKTCFLIITLCLFFQNNLSAQSILDPSDPMVDYDSLNPQQVPPVGQIHKWIRTPRLSWNTSDYKSYILNGISFRLKFPKTYNPTANDGKKYPMLIFFHGYMEGGNVYDNEFQLYLGGEFFKNSVENGTFDGYVIALQANGGFFGGGHYQALKQIMDYMVANNKLDPFSVGANGLSAGGSAVWDMFLQNPTYVSSNLPMSSISLGLTNPALVNTLKFTPFWHQQGGADNNPAPSTTDQVKAAMDAAGANFSNRLFPTLGHDTWSATWADTTFWNFIKRGYASNPWPLFGRSEFCVGETINITVGLAPGFTSYEWRKDGILIPGATSNSIQVTQLGVYSARVERNGIWSEWSKIPVEVKIKAPTITPDIKISGLASRVIPSPDGSDSVNLEVPAGYYSYNWQREGNSTTISNTRFLTVKTPGDYKVKVSEQYSCSSEFSPLFKVVNANGPNKPDPATNLMTTVLSNSSIRLDWNENPAPLYNETNFEVFMATQPGGPYKYNGQTGADVKTYTATGLNPNTNYYFIVRAVNLTGAAIPSNEAGSKTLFDNIPPTAPVLSVNYVTSNSVALIWTASTDDGGIKNYEVYVNGLKSYVTAGTQFVVTNLQVGSIYNFRVKAKDLASNLSQFSNQVTAVPTRGLNFKYYTYTQGMSYLPDFSAMTPNATGNVPNVSIANRTQDDQFAFLWEGYIIIPQTGTYYFRTRSDEGSKVFLGSLNGIGSPYTANGPAIVNNDGTHQPQTVTSQPMLLQQGIYPIAIAYFDYVGGETMELSWRTPQSGSVFSQIPNAQFTDEPVITSVSLPAKPTNLSAAAVSNNKIQLTWIDNSNNEIGFEVFRSVKPFSEYVSVGITDAGVQTFTDSLLKPSTKYYYRVRAFNDQGESDYDLPGQGVDYSYYEENLAGNLPDISAWVPKKTGRINKFGLGLEDRADVFQFKFSTNIYIPFTGVYSFYLTSDDGSKLYIDGLSASNLVIDHDGWHAPTEKAGSINLTKGTHTIYVLYQEAYGDQELTLKISAPGLPKQEMPELMIGSLMANATTWANPATPVTPENLVASGISTSAIQLNWQDHSSNENGFEIFRSAISNTSYILLKTVGANVTSYQDTGLFANAVYYYKVRAKGLAVNSAFTGEDSAKVFNSRPVITDLANRTARYDQQTLVSLFATDADNDALIFSGANLPAFASVANNGNGSATLTLNPAFAQQGVYGNIMIIVNDGHGGADTSIFTLTVNSNYSPVPAAVGNMVMNENEVLNIPLAATDGNAGDLISWSVEGIPFTHSITPGANGSAGLSLHPGYSNAGTYIITVHVNDGNGGFGSLQFNLTVNDAAPAAPSNLLASFIYGQGVKLTWNDNSSNETGFSVLRSASVNGTYAAVGSVAANVLTFTDNTVSTNQTYFYKVQAINAADISAFSNAVSIFTNRIPLLSAVSNVYVKTSITTSVNLSATDDAGAQLVLTATGLPSFAQLIDNGNGTGSINIVTNASSIGVYPIVIKVKDEYDSVNTTSFILSVTDKDLNSVYVNFTNSSHTAPAPWNNFVNASIGGSTMNALKDDANTTTSLSIHMQDGWAETMEEGIRFNTGKEIYPASVTRTGLSDNSSSRRIVISGLDPVSTRYNFVFFNSIDHEMNANTQFTINGQTVTLNGNYNGNKTVQINGIIPASNGTVNIDVVKGSGAERALLNAMIIQSYPASLNIASPSGCKLIAATSNSITIQWQDRSDNETATGGFEIWRADNSNSTYTMVGTVNQNITTFTDGNLTTGKTYFYTVRAKAAGPAYSSYSNVASGTPYVYSVYVNFNLNAVAGAPWNNTNAAPNLGLTMNGLKDEQGVVTSLGMVQANTWSGLYPGGVDNTGNTGIYPDVVMKESFGLFQGITGAIKITGLNFSMKYDLTFFASATLTGDVNVSYTVGNKTIMLNAAGNKSGTVTMYGVMADENGEILINVAPGTNTSQFGLLGALVIRAYSPYSGITPMPSAKSQGNTNSPAVQGKKEFILNAFPNPFTKEFILSFEADKNENLQLSVFDMNGREVYVQEFRHLRNGWNQLKIQPRRTLASGIYLIKAVLDGDRTGTFRIMKN